MPKTILTHDEIPERPNRPARAADPCVTLDPRKRTCLNGWWDFIPIFNAGQKDQIPSKGWIRGKYLVPSLWTKPLDAARIKGTDVYNKVKPGEIGKNHEFLLDCFGYPVEWTTTREGWVRRAFSVASLTPGIRTFLRFDATMPKATFFLNGVRLGRNIHPTLPFEYDVTDLIEQGSNVLAVLIEDYDRDELNRAKVPAGNYIQESGSGIWQDVWLIERSDLYLSDVTIRTSTRERTITVIGEVTNAGASPRSVKALLAVTKWHKGVSPKRTANVLDLPTQELTVAPGGRASFRIDAPWEDARWWYPESPVLYLLRTTIMDRERVVSRAYERFGFREIWIDGPDLMLNGYPLHLFSDWGHKPALWYATEAWTRTWFGMIRDANMNHTRLHTHPHPPFILDMADEMGILVTGEAGLHGSGNFIASASPETWVAAEDHVRRFVKRDKNHPCIILWSVGNEMRWNKIDRPGDQTRAQLPRLRKLFNELDSTRPAYHEGDSSLWNEAGQAIISRHYGRECAGTGWWNKKQPLHGGEMSLYHYEGPNCTAHLGGDAVYADTRRRITASARDCALVIEAARANGVCCLGPWNLSCLSNLRTNAAADLEYDDWSAPGVKPLHVAAHACEFAFWKSGKGYAPNLHFGIQKAAFRPFAVIDLSQRCSYYGGAAMTRELHVVNDTARAVHGTLVAEIVGTGGVAGGCSREIALGRGMKTAVNITLTIPVKQGSCRYRCTFTEGTKVLDTWTRTLRSRSRIGEVKGRAAPLAVFGNGSLRTYLASAGIAHRYVPDLAAGTLAEFRTLILEKESVAAGRSPASAVGSFVNGGGRVVVLEQTTSLFAAIAIEEKPVHAAFKRAYAHPILRGIADDELAFWGDAPYTLWDGDAYVARSLYRKDDLREMIPVLDCGDDDLEFTPLFEARIGKGVIVAIQLRITDSLDHVPAAQRLLLNAVSYCAAYRPRTRHVEIIDASDPGLSAAIAAARKGGCAIVSAKTTPALKRLGKALGIPLQGSKTTDTYQAVRVNDNPALSGISQADACGIEAFTYTAGKENRTVASLVIHPSKAIEPLLTTTDASGLKEFFVDGGASEPLRAHTYTRILTRKAARPLIVVGRIRTGTGWVIINQVDPDVKDAPKFSRLVNRLAGNFGGPSDGKLLQGQCPKRSQDNGGYPQSVFVWSGDCTPEIWKRMAEDTAFTYERLVSMPVLNSGGWKKIDTPDGIVKAEGLAGPDVCVYYVIGNYRLRGMTRAKEQGVPDSGALAFLDLAGKNGAEAVVNADARPAVPVRPDGASVSNFPLNLGNNHVLIRWRPSSAASTLSMRWRDASGNPEGSFIFFA